MYKVTVGIPTYKRPKMLEKLVNSIFSSNIDRSLIGTLDIVVVDNDVDRTAEALINRLIANNTSEFFKLHYHCYPIKGLSNVRNEIIGKALLLQPDYIAFMDDDEYVNPEWLNELTRTVIQNKGDFAMGPVIADFETKVSPAIAEGFPYFKYADQTKVHFIHSGNMIMRSQFIRDQEMKFDPRFNTLGAEDSYFGLTALKKGGSIFWAKKAIAYETIPAKRASLNWLIKRRFRGGNTYVYILLLEKQYGKVIKKIAVSLFYLCIGALAALLTPIPFKHRYFGILKIAETLGALAALFDIKYHEYLKTR